MEMSSSSSSSSSSPKTSSSSSSNSRHRHGRHGWSVFDMIKPFPPTPTPETLIPDIDAAIAASEHAHSSSLLLLHSKDNPPLTILDEDGDDARLADEAYRAACTALASGSHNAAVSSLKVAIAACPPGKTLVMAKLKSLLDIALSQLDLRTHQKQ